MCHRDKTRGKVNLLENPANMEMGTNGREMALCKIFVLFSSVFVQYFTFLVFCSFTEHLFPLKVNELYDPGLLKSALPSNRSPASAFPANLVRAFRVVGLSFTANSPCPSWSRPDWRCFLRLSCVGPLPWSHRQSGRQSVQGLLPDQCPSCPN